MIISFQAIFSFSASAQTDTLKVKRDTIGPEMKEEVLKPDSTLKSKSEKSDEFYEKFQNLFRKHKVFKKVEGMVLRNKESDHDSLGMKMHINDTTKNILALTNLFTEPENIEETYKFMNGKITGNIYYRRFDPFGYDIDDPDFPPQTKATRVMNNLHVETKDRILAHALNFKPGDPINAATLAFDENYIRNFVFIKDCRIVPIFREYCISDSVCYSTDTIDFIIITQDAWSLIPSITINRVPDAMDVIDGQLEKALYETKYRIRLSDFNLAGLGHELSGTYYHNGNLSSPDAFRVSYSIPVFTKAQATLNAKFDVFPEEHSVSVNFNRNFVTPVTKYGYGLSSGISTVYGDFIKDTLRRYLEPVKFSLHDAWIGRSFKLWFLPAAVSSKTRGIVSLRYFTIADINPITDFNDSTQQYQNNFATLGSIGVTSRSYFRDVLVFGFGRTENIPSGISAAFTAGYNKVSVNDLLLMRLSFAGGKYLHNTGYYYLTTTVDGLYNKSGITDWGFQVTGNHFSKLYQFGNWKFRQFYKTQFIYIHNNVYQLQTNLDRNNGIRGKGSDLWRGTQKLLVSFESIFFTPLDLVGFNLNFYSFLDCGIINNRYTSLFKNSLYQGLGLGVRIRNDHFVMNVIQVQFGFYPNVPYDASSTSFSAGNISQYQLSDFTVNKPLLYNN